MDRTAYTHLETPVYQDAKASQLLSLLLLRGRGQDPGGPRVSFSSHPRNRTLVFVTAVPGRHAAFSWCCSVLQRGTRGVHASRRTGGQRGVGQHQEKGIFLLISKFKQKFCCLKGLIQRPNNLKSIILFIYLPSGISCVFF